MPIRGEKTLLMELLCPSQTGAEQRQTIDEPKRTGHRKSMSKKDSASRQQAAARDPEYGESATRIRRLLDDHWVGYRKELSIAIRRIQEIQKHSLEIPSDQVIPRVINGTRRIPKWRQFFNLVCFAVAESSMKNSEKDEFNSNLDLHRRIESFKSYVFEGKEIAPQSPSDLKSAAIAQQFFLQASDMDVDAKAHLRIEQDNNGRIIIEELTYCFDPQVRGNDLRVCLRGLEVRWGWRRSDHVSLGQARAAVNRLNTSNDDPRFAIQALFHRNATLELVLGAPTPGLAFSPEYDIAIERIVLPDARIAEGSEHDFSIYARWQDVCVAGRAGEERSFVVMGGQNDRLEEQSDAIHRLALANLERIKNDFPVDGSPNLLGRCSARATAVATPRLRLGTPVDGACRV